MTTDAMILERLTEIRDLLQTLVAPPPVEDGCSHPEDARISLKAMGMRGEHWRCGVCGEERHTHP